MIAYYLRGHGIAYYEATASTNWSILQSKISRPDFYLPKDA
jgi:hypothetical protein